MLTLGIQASIVRTNQYLQLQLILTFWLNTGCWITINYFSLKIQTQLLRQRKKKKDPSCQRFSSKKPDFNRHTEVVYQNCFAFEYEETIQSQTLNKGRL